MWSSPRLHTYRRLTSALKVPVPGFFPSAGLPLFAYASNLSLVSSFDSDHEQNHSRNDRQTRNKNQDCRCLAEVTGKSWSESFPVRPSPARHAMDGLISP